MKPKSIKNLMKNRVDFCNDFECFICRSWIDLGSKNFSKMDGLGVTFSTSLRVCEKCDFEQPSYGVATFSKFGSLEFRSQKVCFSNVFPKSLQRHICFDSGPIFCFNLEPKWGATSFKKSMKFSVENSTIF